PPPFCRREFVGEDASLGRFAAAPRRLPPAARPATGGQLHRKRCFYLGGGKLDRRTLAPEALSRCRRRPLVVRHPLAADARLPLPGGRRASPRLDDLPAGRAACATASSAACRLPATCRAWRSVRFPTDSRHRPSAGTRHRRHTCPGPSCSSRAVAARQGLP